MPFYINAENSVLKLSGMGLLFFSLARSCEKSDFKQHLHRVSCPIDNKYIMYSKKTVLALCINYRDIVNGNLIDFCLHSTTKNH